MTGSGNGPSQREGRFGVAHETLTIKSTPKSTRMITRELTRWLGAIGALSGTITVFCQHTSASLTIQENADPTVQDDLLDYLGDIAPETRLYRHCYEGADDMPAHIKTMLTSVSESIPVQNGQMMLGQWQGVFVLEHRAHAHHRNIHLCFTGLLRG